MTIYNVPISARLSECDDWQNKAPIWAKLGQGVGAVSEANPLTIKQRYVTGVILNYCRSVEILLKQEYLFSTTYFPAFAVFSASIELLGRCINGGTSSREMRVDLEAGFKWLAEPNFSTYQSISNDHILVSTSIEYSIEELIRLRNFSAHGLGSNQSSIEAVDYLILGKMPRLLGTGIEKYLSELNLNTDLADKLGEADVTPFHAWQIADGAWGFQNQDANLLPVSVGDAFRKLDWTCKERPIFGFSEPLPSQWFTPDQL